VVLGGSTPEDSPFLRRPDLLRSMLGYWLAHPSLSFAFSGMFVGPTSQAPRIDEARDDAVHELDLAFRQIPSDGNGPPWLVDRVLRNLLADASGNTHRTEFCIDKLYSPDSASGRLGLLELRSFEMPPHERMSLVQQLLVRALVAKFWRIRGPPRRPAEQHRPRPLDAPPLFGTGSVGVLSDLRAAGFPFQDAWFRPHLEFRFPKVGSFVREGTEVEIRQALEPWHVLAEEPGGGGTVATWTARSSACRCWCGAPRPDATRCCATAPACPCTPRAPTAKSVAGVRYRAWQPPSCLHPTVGVHAPLVLELYDQWAGRGVASATYHVQHPGGRAYESHPVNANEAESRRHERFQSFGNAPATLVPRDCPPRPEAPLTLDLRWI